MNAPISVFPKPEEIWVYHTLEYTTGATQAKCPRCRMEVPVEVAHVSGMAIPKGCQIFLPIYLRAGASEDAREKRPPSRFIVRCVPHDARMDVLKIPDFLAEVGIEAPCLTGRHQ